MPWPIHFGYVEWWNPWTVWMSHYTQANSSLTIVNFVVLRHHACAKTGGCTVGIKCFTACLATVVEKVGVVSDGNSFCKWWKTLAERLVCVNGPVPPVWHEIVAKDTASTSTNKQFAHRKFKPMMGTNYFPVAVRCTAAAWHGVWIADPLPRLKFGGPTLIILLGEKPAAKRPPHQDDLCLICSH